MTPSDLRSDQEVTPVVADRPEAGTYVFPTSLGQRRLWFQEQWEPGSALYNIPLALRLTGRLDVAALERSLEEIVRRHEALRTTFESVDGEPMQVIAPPPASPLQIVDLETLPGDERAARAGRLAREYSARPFDLIRGPLLRAVLLRLDAQDHILSLTLHHIVSDAWSQGLLVRELAALYPAFSKERPSPLSDPPLQYADFAVWQREWLESGVLEEHLAYWRRHLDAAPSLLAMPTDRPRPPVQTARGRGHAVAVPPDLVAPLQTLCRREGVTLFMMLLAVFQTLLSRFTGEDDLVVGTPVAGRTEPGLETLVGCLVNTLALRVSLSGNPTFRGLLARVREVCLEGYAHQDLPFERLVETLRPKRHLSHTPLFQVMLALDNVPPAPLEIPGLSVTALPVGTGTAKYDLTLALAETTQGLRGSLEYSADLFDPPTISLLAEHFVALLESAIAEPDRRLSDLPPPVPRAWEEARERFFRPEATGIGVDPGERSEDAADGDAAPRTPIERTLERIWAGLLRVERIGIHDNFFAAGGDSILSLQVVARAHQAGIHLTPKQLFQHQTIAELAAVAESAAPAMAEQGIVTGEVPLTPIQRWFFELDLPDPHHWNQAFVLETREPLAPALLAEAARHLFRHHDALRLRFTRVAEGARQANAGAEAPPEVPYRDLSTLNENDQAQAIAVAAARLQSSLDLAEGPLLRLALFDLGPGRPGRLVIVIHHLAVDGVSWRILLEDLELACRQLAGGEAVRLPAKTTAFRAWAHRLAEYARSEEPRQDLAYWLDEGRAQAGRLPLDMPGGDNLEISARSVFVALEEGETRSLLQEVPKAYRTQINDVLVTALSQALARWTGARALRIDLEGHGREDLVEGADLSRTVGWFTSLFPVVLRLEDARVPGEALRSIKEQLRRVPRHGITYGLLRYLGGDAEIAARLRGLPQAEVTFNYLGQFDQSLPDESPFGLARQDAGPAHGPRGRRSHLIEIDGFIASGRLQLRFTYSEACHRRATIERLTDHYMEALRGLITHCLSPEAHWATPSDFPLADLDQRELEQLLAGHRSIKDVYPLAPMQAGMLFHTLLAPDSGEYVEQLTCTLRGDLDLPAFERAWQQVVDRHDSLRAHIYWERRGRPLQIVRRQVPVPMTVLDWTDVESAKQDARLERLLQEDRARGFNLARAPLLRLAICRTAADAYRFVLSHHHLLLDGWSLAVLLKEVFASYEALRRAQVPRLAPARSYAAYIAWLEKQDTTGAEAFWRGTLEGFRAPTPLRLSRPPGTTSPAAGRDEQELRLTAAVTEALGALARRQQLTLNTIALGAWALVLGRQSGMDDVVFGATVSGRPPALPGVEELVGLCINTLPVRVRVDPETDLIPWLRDLQAKQAELRQHEHSSLPQIRTWSEVPPGQPLFESILVFENYPVDASLRDQDGSIKVEDVRSIEWTNYPLTVGVGPGPRLALCFSYDRSRFDAAAIAHLLGEYRQLLERIAANPAERLDAVAQPDPAARRRPKVEATPLQVRPASTQLIHEQVAAQAARTPEAPAILGGEERLTYAELEARANRLAHALLRIGVGPEALVGVCLSRSPDIAVAVLGILKAGGAYLPLDSGSPPERLRRLVAEARPVVVLAHRAFLARLPADPAAPVICLDADPPIVTREPADPPAVRVGPENLAYVIHTSGSTGTPKGVQVPHRALMNHGTALARSYGLTSSDRVLQFASLSFDVAAEELFPTWLAGACVVLRTEATSLVAPDLLAWVEREGVTVLNLPAPYWHTLVEALVEPPGTLPAPVLPACLRLMVVGSDRVAADRWAQWRERVGGGVRLVNAYGPTEATITATLFEDAPGQGVVTGQTVPIGRPIANVEAHLLDGWLQPVPVGSPGELCIGGAGLARGYLGHPDLTAEHFVPHPRSAVPGARLYRTGDLARQRSDGTLEYLGRCDTQVKVRGYRVELGEIEAALCRYPAVSGAVVTLCEARSGERRLAAYAVPCSGRRVVARALRDHLTTCLPEYMVPSSITLLETLPLTPGGKVDRRALPLPEWAGRSMWAGQAERDPREERAGAGDDPALEIIAGIWAQVMGLARVEVEDNFFALGGHSLLATQIVSRLRDAFQVELPLRSLFDNPTAVGLAACVQAARRRAHGLQPAMPLRPLRRDGRVPLSFAQERQWFLDQLVPDRPVYNIHVALRMVGWLDTRALRRSLNALVRRHEVLRTVFAAVEGRPAQVILPRLTIRLPVIDLESLHRDERQAESRRLSTSEARRPFDLERGPLLRARLVRLAAEEHVLLITMHHIVSDGWSASVSARELAALYDAYRSGEPAALPEPPIQYADFAVWQRAWLQGEELERQLAYWRRQLAGAPRVLRLPADRPRPTAHSYEGATQQFTLPPALSLRLKELSRREGVTLFMTMLAGFQMLLLRYTGQDDLVLGSPIAGRMRTETEGLIGFFVNTLVLRTDLSGDPPFRELLRRVREVCLEAYTHQDLPFEKLVEDLAPERSLRHTPLVQVMFQLQTVATSTLELTGLTMNALDVDSGTTQFDLSVDLLEGPDGLVAVMEYSTDLFDAATISRLMAGYQTLLEGAVEQPERRLSELPLLTESERRSVLEWSPAPGDRPAETSLHGLVEEQARRRPDAVAVSRDGERLIYGELDRRSGQLASYLRRLGVGPETLVAVCLERSEALAVAILGILKAGGVYLPLDPAYPAERIAFILADASPRLLVTQQSLRERLPRNGVRLVCLDEARGSIDGEPTGCPSDMVHAARPAYVIYTSGSTGRPKGVVIPHQAAVNHNVAVARAYTLGPDDRVLQFAAPSFDVALEELFASWSSGAAVVLRPDVLPAPADLPELVARERLSVLNLPSSYWHDWVAELGTTHERLPGCLRLVVVGSEPISPERYAEWRRLIPPEIRWVGAYGATEAAVTSMLFEAAVAGESETPHELPIGRPIANMQAYVLDDALRPLPIGAIGELYLGGVGLARGYLGRPDFTAERFVPHPHSHRPGARLYRTGDRARLRSDGNIVFLGRADLQVKVRGYRIEPGEVEAALRRHPAVGEAAVVAREDRPGEKRLVAYVVPDFASGDASRAQRETEARTELIGEWRLVHDDEVFNQITPDADPTFNIGGWNRSDTGEPIPAEEMREWVDGTVDRILGLRPRRLLEIGCGTGLLLFHVAPHCTAYVGTDFSSAALGHVRRALAASDPPLPHVRLLEREANDFKGLEGEPFDLVILNSVAQYFPGVDYLEEVLAGAFRLVGGAGRVFVGDLRSLPLLRAFHTSIALRRAPATLTLAQLDHLVEQRLFQEEELVIDPAFFSALTRRIGGIDRFDVQLRRGRRRNEMSRFRYDVILHADRVAPNATVPPRVDWQVEGLTLDALRQRLADESPENRHGNTCVRPDRRTGSAGDRG
jgi:amino acid adenylation domain-containing protein/non-ribosomal peptide synthase protein (TIGR01720 family)